VESRHEAAANLGNIANYAAAKRADRVGVLGEGGLKLMVVCKRHHYELARQGGNA
jgi:hypothetical protein